MEEQECRSRCGRWWHDNKLNLRSDFVNIFSLFHRSSPLPTFLPPDGSRIDGTSLETNQICNKSLYLTRYEEADGRGRPGKFKRTNPNS
ncbi:hypothetical protein K443DRAFT_258471 [Laccaria amethystina LaAM-08-1]|uniref:Uncharacterized protein n=1 Tax=Laccaria amethystina LaAM-08-1 TaxID=1095629 RepID=A0A0C9WX08_9AGAR|nr:hypothetical protein K443DRAFT_258471 [Laccaria amethystina LaAM-08-1]